MKRYQDAERAWQQFLRGNPTLARTFDPNHRADATLQVTRLKMLRSLIGLMHKYFVLGYMMGRRD